MLPIQSMSVLSDPHSGPSRDSLRFLEIIALSTIGAVLAYATFEWGGVLRSDRYQYLLVLGLLAIPHSLVLHSELTELSGP